MFNMFHAVQPGEMNMPWVCQVSLVTDIDFPDFDLDLEDWDNWDKQEIVWMKLLCREVLELFLLLESFQTLKSIVKIVGLCWSCMNKKGPYNFCLIKNDQKLDQTAGDRWWCVVVRIWGARWPGYHPTTPPKWPTTWSTWHRRLPKLRCHL